MGLFLQRIVREDLKHHFFCHLRVFLDKLQDIVSISGYCDSHFHIDDQNGVVPDGFESRVWVDASAIANNHNLVQIVIAKVLIFKPLVHLFKHS